MAKSVPVYRFTADSPHFYVSKTDALQRVDRHGYLLLNPAKLTDGIRFPGPPPSPRNYLELAAGGVFRSAWHVADSNSFMVWQMRSGAAQMPDDRLG